MLNYIKQNTIDNIMYRSYSIWNTMHTNYDEDGNASYSVDAWRNNNNRYRRESTTTTTTTNWNRKKKPKNTNNNVRFQQYTKNSIIDAGAEDPTADVIS